MNAYIYSLYWDNLDPQIVAAQKLVFDHFGIAINQHRINGYDHGEWIDWVMTRMDSVDVFLFIDADCVILSKEKLMNNFQLAAGGTLVGAEGAANHIDPLRSYAGAWFTFINRKIWDQTMRPSARATPHNDVCQMWTDTWRHYKLPVSLIPPTGCMTPRWDLPGRPKAYGIGTTYGDDCFHLFDARTPGNQDIFVSRCQEIIK